ncbi:TetR family transcriptional regulator [Streptomyces sp. L7]
MGTRGGSREDVSPDSGRLDRTYTDRQAAGHVGGGLERLGFDLFARHGFDRTTVDDIAAAAGIGRRTFFRYFASKNDLVWGDFEGQLVRLRELLDANGPDA